MKRCFKCLQLKNIKDYYAHRGMADGHLSKCKDCTKHDSLSYYKNTPAKKRRADRNAWKYKNKDKVKEMNRLSRKRHPSTMVAQTAKRRAQHKQAAPKWLTKQHYSEIKAFYKEAKELSWLSLDRLEVDHIIPLQSEIVCGLHVPWNLQILPKSHNVKKGNKVA